MKRRPVIVEWLDSVTPYPGWIVRREFKKPRAIKVYSVGYIIRQNATAIALCQSIGSRPRQFMGIVEIPCGAIIRIRKLK